MFWYIWMALPPPPQPLLFFWGFFLAYQGLRPKAKLRFQTNLKSKVTSRVLLAIGKLRPHNQDTSGYDDIRQQLRQCEMWDFKRGDLRFQIFIHQSDDADPLASTIELRRWKGPTDGSNFFC